VSSCPELLDRLAPQEHVVQLYGRDDRLLTRNVGRFLSVGLKRGDGLLVIATSEHRTNLTRRLSEELGYAGALLSGRLVMLDAEETLSRFMVDGDPDPELFGTVIGEALKEVSAHSFYSGVRAYGEMVGVLWQAGAQQAAIRLEALWNGLLHASDVTLFCGYPIDLFGADFQSERIDPLLCSHSHLLPLDPDLDRALTRAMEEVLGPRMDRLRELMQPNHRPAWGQVPGAESQILWLRNNLPGSADQIITLAREYYYAGLA
jgi:hypothetical protein